MNPIFIARKSVFPLSLRVERRWPAIQTSPDVKSSIPDRQFRRVVLPHPDGPITATISPLRTSRSRPRSAWTAPPPLSYVLTRRRATTMRSSVREPSEDAAEGDEEKDAERRERQRGRLQLDPREERRGDESAGDRGRDPDGEAFDWDAEGLRRRQEDEEGRARREADGGEAEHEPPEISRGTLRRRQDDPEVVPLIEGPIDREDSEGERQRLRHRGDPGQTRSVPAGTRRQDPDNREQGHEEDAPVPPDPDEMEAGHEARVPAPVGPEAHASRDPAEPSRDMPLDFHPRAHVDLAEPRGHRRPQAMDDVRVAQGVPAEGDSARVDEREEDVEDWRRRAAQNGETERSERGRGERKIGEADGERGVREGCGREDRDDEERRADESDWDPGEPDPQDDEDLRRHQHEERVDDEEAEQRQGCHGRSSHREDHTEGGDSRGEATGSEQADELEEEVRGEVVPRAHIGGQEEVELRRVGRDPRAEGVQQSERQKAGERGCEHADGSGRVGSADRGPEGDAEREAGRQEDQDQANVRERSEASAEGRPEEKSQFVREEREGPRQRPIPSGTSLAAGVSRRRARRPPP